MRVRNWKNQWEGKEGMSGNLTGAYHEWVVNPELSVEPGIGTFPLTQLLYRGVVDKFEESLLILPEPVFELSESSQ